MISDEEKIKAFEEWFTNNIVAGTYDACAFVTWMACSSWAEERTRQDERERLAKYLLENQKTDVTPEESKKLEQYLYDIYISCVEFYQSIEDIDAVAIINAPVEDWKMMAEGYIYLYQLYKANTDKVVKH